MSDQNNMKNTDRSSTGRAGGNGTGAGRAGGNGTGAGRAGSAAAQIREFLGEHRPAAAIAGAAIILLAVLAALSIFAYVRDRSVDYITVVYDGDTKEGVVLDSSNPGFSVTAHYHNGEEEAVTGWEIREPVTLKEAQESTVIVSYRGAGTQVKIQCTTGLIRSITAEYDGSTEAGVSITDTNPGIHVYAIRSNGKKEELEGGWRVVNPTLLEADKSSQVQIKYEELSCVLTIRCTTRSIVRLTASYAGSTQEGTVIGTGCEGLTVTAAYADGESEEVEGWTLAKEVRLEPRQHYVLEIHYQDQFCTAEVTCTTPTRKEYMEGCIRISYSAMSRNPGRYTGTNVYISGTIEELRRVEDGSVDVILSVKGDFLGFTTRTVCAEYASTLHGDLPAAGSAVTVYGMFRGLYDINTESGTESVPVIAAEYVVE